MLNEILAKHTGQPIERIAKDTDRDRYLTAAQAKEYGLVDDILTRPPDADREDETNDTRSPISMPRTRMTMPLIPYVIEKSGREERAMDIYSRLLKDRIIFLGSAINDDVANSIVAQMLFLQSEDPKGGHPPVHQLARRQRHRRAGDLRHDAVRHLRRGHLLHRPVRLDGGRAADRRRRAASATRCPTRGS